MHYGHSLSNCSREYLIIREEVDTGLTLAFRSPSTGSGGIQYGTRVVSLRSRQTIDTGLCCSLLRSIVIQVLKVNILCTCPCKVYRSTDAGVQKENM
jgi:hypothetical protein